MAPKKSIIDESEENEELDQRAIAVEFFRLIKEGKVKDGLRFFSPDCIQHNPFIGGDMDALTDSMITTAEEGSTNYPEAEFMVKHVLSDGDMVAVHTQLVNSASSPNEGLRQVHLFRFSGNKIVEYWDITQQILSNMPNAEGAF